MREILGTDAVETVQFDYGLPLGLMAYWPDVGRRFAVRGTDLGQIARELRERYDRYSLELDGLVATPWGLFHV